MVDVVAPMVGKVIRVLVQEGDKVDADDELLIFEAMKMEMPITAPTSGIVKDVQVKPDDVIEENSVIMVIGEE